MKYYKKENTVIAVSEEETVPTGFVEISETDFNTFNSIVDRINELKFELKKSDYKAIKHSEGLISDEYYASIKAERAELRNKINELEAELAEIH